MMSTSDTGAVGPTSPRRPARRPATAGPLARRVAFRSAGLAGDPLAVPPIVVMIVFGFNDTPEQVQHDLAGLHPQVVRPACSTTPT